MADPQFSHLKNGTIIPPHKTFISGKQVNECKATIYGRRAFPIGLLYLIFLKFHSAIFYNFFELKEFSCNMAPLNF